LSRNPVFEVRFTTGLSHLTMGKIVSPHFEAGNEAGPTGGNVPVASDLHCVFFGEDG
jgi:hypothetical protein